MSTPSQPSTGWQPLPRDQWAPPSAAPAATPGRGLVARPIAWLALLVALALASALALGWGLYMSRIHSDARPVAARGQAWTAADGTVFRVTRIATATELAGYSKGDPPVTPPAGQSFVLVTFRVTHLPAKPFCSFRLYGRDDDSWDETKLYTTRATTGCYDLAEREQHEGEFQVLYQVPTNRLPGIIGVAQDFWSLSSQKPPILSPAA